MIAQPSIADKFANLRPDQEEVLHLLNQLIEEVISSPNPQAMSVMWIDKADLLQDRQINWITNLKRPAFRDLISHAYQRINRNIDPYSKGED